MKFLLFWLCKNIGKDMQQLFWKEVNIMLHKKYRNAFHSLHIFHKFLFCYFKLYNFFKIPSVSIKYFYGKKFHMNC